MNIWEIIYVTACVLLGVLYSFVAVGMAKLKKYTYTCIYSFVSLVWYFNPLIRYLILGHL